MHPTVRTYFPEFIEPWEGRVSYMYLDKKALVTIGIGNLIDPVGWALGIPFRFKLRSNIATPGVLATRQQIQDEWRRVKDKVVWKGKWVNFDFFTELEISGATLNDLVNAKLTAMEEELERHPRAFGKFDDWPADAQLGLLTMAWALGPTGVSRFHNFGAACSQQNWKRAAQECHFHTREDRNRAIKALFNNAAFAIEYGFAPDFLYYPEEYSPS